MDPQTGVPSLRWPVARTLIPTCFLEGSDHRPSGTELTDFPNAHVLEPGALRALSARQHLQGDARPCAALDRDRFSPRTPKSHRPSPSALNGQCMPDHVVACSIAFALPVAVSSNAFFYPGSPALVAEDLFKAPGGWAFGHPTGDRASTEVGERWPAGGPAWKLETLKERLDLPELNTITLLDRMRGPR